MQTYSHFLITALANNRLKAKGVDVKSKEFLLGSVAPDLPLFALTFGFFIARMFVDPSFSDGPFPQLYDDLYFYNPFWVGLHNLFHAPLMIIAYAGLGYYAMRKGRSWGAGLMWFALGCGLHSLIDIPTHANDGPLLFFPFDWMTRYNAPISYWDSQFYGREFAIFEHLLDLGILIFLGWMRFKHRFGFGSDGGQADAVESRSG